jgi:type II secretory pathway pseudopilin PulG
MLSRRARRRAGFSLAEIIVATTVLAALGLAFTQLMLTQGRFSDQQNALRGARTVARQSMNVLLSELRMVQDSGFVVSAAADGKSITVDVPYRFGISCDDASGGTKTVVSVLPVDSLLDAQAKYFGFAWRANDGTYYKELLSDVGGAAPTVPSTSSSQCSSEGIGVITVAGRTGQIIDLRPAGPTGPGGAVFLFQRVTYAFKASVAFPGKKGLWRQATGGTDEELVAPFDTTARFKYWKQGATASTAAPPALDSIRGVDVVLAGLSTYTPSGKTSPSVSTLVTSVFFKNVRSY